MSGSKGSQPVPSGLSVDVDRDLSPELQISEAATAASRVINEDLVELHGRIDKPNIQ